MVYSVNYIDSLNRYSGFEVEADNTVDLFNMLLQFSSHNKIGTSRRGRIKEVLEIIELNNN